FGYNWNLFLNGNPVSYIGGWPQNSGFNPPTGNLVIGNGFGEANPLNGQIDEVKIFNTARTASQIQMDMSSTNPNGAIGYWDFEESTGNVALDQSGSGNNATFIHNPLRALRVTDNTDNGGTGLGSLRQAINDANTDTDKDYIDFSVASGIQTIQPSLAYAISNPIYIDGFSQLNTIPGENSMANTNAFGLPINSKLNVVISGATPGGNCFVLNSAASGSVFKGLVINNFGSNGSGTAAFNLQSFSNNHLISGCYIGVNRDGTAVSGAEINGVSLLGSAASTSTIGGVNDLDRNLISSGELFWNSTSDNLIMGNYFGTNAAGDTYLSDVRISSIWSSSPMIFQQNVVSGTMYIESASSNTKIVNNLFGTKADGTGVVSNNSIGIQVGNTGQSRGSSNVLIANNSIANKTYGVIIDGSA
ncbi:MAG: LamG domain-containing protein, partial [Cytophagales bacterium]|nr:LamG domain-containing protein [Cytophagales bacterium]